MKLNSKDIDFLSQCAMSAALQAGKIIQHYANKEITHELKSGDGCLASKIVTQVDILAQEAILNTLSESCLLYDIAILTEESEDNKSRLEKDFFWCIDPLDGTIYYSQHKPGYAVSIALVSKSGESLLGVIYDPHEQKLYSAIKGQHNLINQQVFNLDKSVKTTVEFSRFNQDPNQISNEVTILCDQHYLQQKEFNLFIDKFHQLLVKNGYQSTKILAHGGAVKNAIAVLEHSPACYFKLPKIALGGGCLWDYAASSCFFNKADGSVATDISGNKLNLNSSISVHLNHCGITYASHQKIANCLYKLNQSK